VIEDILGDAGTKMAKAVAHTQAEFSSIRTGRASPALVEKLTVDYYGSEVPLQQLAGFTVPEARMLVVQPYDRGAMAAIEKAIQHSDLGINPSNDGHVIRLAFPPLTAERRQDFVRVVKHMAEEGRVVVRNLRRAARHELEVLEGDGGVAADERERAEKDLEKLTTRHVGDIDVALEHKERELLEV
jgi:ribosome recycling factor